MKKILLALTMLTGVTNISNAATKDHTGLTNRDREIIKQLRDQSIQKSAEEK